MNEGKTAGRVRLLCDLSRLTENYKRLSALLLRQGTAPIAVVKANAYGHGMLPISRALFAAGARRFAVSSLEEGLALRAALGDADILVLGYVPPAAARTAARARLTLSLFDLAGARALSAALGGGGLTCHVKLNSGMNRYGFSLLPEELSRTVAEVTEALSLPGIRAAGVYSHLASADRVGDGQTRTQVARFLAALAALGAVGISLPAHLAATAGVLSGEVPPLALARVGLGLYGYAPLGSLPLLPVGRLECDIAQSYPLARGEAVGYGGGYVAKRREWLAILPIGYADGLPRSAEGGYVRIGGVPCPIVGRVAMDAVAVLATDAPRDARCATVFGDTGDDLFALSAAAGTIPYELLAGLGARIDRKYSYEEPYGHRHSE